MNKEELIKSHKIAAEEYKQIILDLVSEGHSTHVLMKDFIKDYIKMLICSSQTELLNPFLREMHSLNVVNINNKNDSIIDYCSGLISVCERQNEELLTEDSPFEEGDI